MGSILGTSIFVRAMDEQDARRKAAKRIAERTQNFEITSVTRMSQTGWRISYNMERPHDPGDWGAPPITSDWDLPGERRKGNG